MATGGGFGKTILARHTNSRDARLYPKNDFPRSTLARRSTSKIKSKRKERVNTLPAQDLEDEREEGKEAVKLT
jgi:hypothetical protein